MANRFARAADVETSMRLLADRLRRIEKRLRDLPDEIEAAQPGSAEAIELGTEQLDLEAYRRDTEKEIRRVREKPVIDEQREARVRALVAEQDQLYEASQARWKAQGEYHQARLFRRQHLTVRERIERESGVSPVVTG